MDHAVLDDDQKPATCVAAVNRGERLALLDNNEVVPIFGYINEDGDVVATKDMDPEASAGFIAGPCPNGKVYYDFWVTFENAEYN